MACQGLQRTDQKLLLGSKCPISFDQASDKDISIRGTANLPNIVDDYDQGYGKVAAFEDCDPNFLIYRKFGWLHNRVILHTQDELQELEERLEGLDKWEVSDGDKEILKHRREDDENPDSPRKELLKTIKAKLAEYDELVFRLQKKTEIRKPTKRNQNSVYNLINTSHSLTSSEALWIRQWDDLMAPAYNAEHGWFNGILEDALRGLSKRITLVSHAFQCLTCTRFFPYHRSAHTNHYTHIHL